eukprot:jgi/Mesvir1/28419/Mv15848-RA.1
MGNCFSAGEGTGAAGLSGPSAHHNLSEADAAASLLEGGGLSALIELSISAKGLVNRDVLSKSDPMAVLMELRNGAWVELGRTEVVSNELSPTFVTLIRMDYKFETVQTIRVAMYDVDTAFDFKSPRDLDLRQQQELGVADFILADIVIAPGKQKSVAIKRPGHAHNGSVTIRVEEVARSNADVMLTLRAEGLDKKDTVSGSSDPFLRISRVREDGTPAPLYKTEVVKKNLNPRWTPIRATMQQLCNGDVDRPLLVECLDWNRSGLHSHIGATTVSLRDLEGLATTGGAKSLTVKGPDGRARVAGKLLASECKITPRHSFLDYVFGGCEISFLVAIDFTASNGVPNQPTSLHHISNRPNIYQQAIQSVGEVIQFYDSDKRFPAWGFGASFDRNPVSHCFSLNGDPANPEVVGVQGILDAYVQALSVMNLSGPTLFAPVINYATQIASKNISQQDQHYFCLLIVTDGVIMDMDNTKAALLEAANLPLSVIIIGVGDADFTLMRELDADKTKLSLNGVTASRDCVQFVAFKDYAAQAPGMGVRELAKDVLAELPGQLVEAMRLRGIHPNPPRAPDHSATAPLPPVGATVPNPMFSGRT